MQATAGDPTASHLQNASACYTGSMPARRPLRSPCPIAGALDILGDRWTLLVMRDILFYGKRRYADFLASPEGIASNILAERLTRLERGGVHARETLELGRPQ